MRTEYNIVLKEKPFDEGLTKEEVVDLFDMLSGPEAIPVEIQGESSSAMGIINLTDAEYMSYDYTALEELVKSILNDMDCESETCKYEVPNAYGVSTMYLSR